MGCDIHCYSEVKVHQYDDKAKLNGKWVNADKWTHNPYALFGLDEEKMEVLPEDAVMYWRWYAVFAILADVRNHWNIKAVSEPKGFPPDACEVVKKDYEMMGYDAHSASWLTLPELEAYPMDEHFPDEEDEPLKTEWKRILDAMRKRVETFRVEPQYVRIVFWFDN